MPAGHHGRDGLHDRLRRVLRAAASRGVVMTYRDLAVEAEAPPPHTIHETTLALEDLARDDHRAGRPLLAALAVGKAGLPGPGFFQLLRKLGRYDGADRGEEAARHHAGELREALRYWGGEAEEPGP